MNGNSNASQGNIAQSADEYENITFEQVNAKVYRR